MAPAERLRLDALGWAWLGNAYYLAYKFTEAEEAISKALRLLDTARESGAVLGEVLYLQGQLRLFQRQLVDASSLLNRSVEILRPHGPSAAYASALILQGSVYYALGRPEDSLAPLTEASDFVLAASDPYLRLSAVQSLASSLVATGDIARAEAFVREAKSLCGRIENLEGEFQICWLEGLVELSRSRFGKAQIHLSKARDGLAELGNIGYSAVVSLDLAQAYELGGRPGEAVQAIRTAMPLIQSLDYEREALAAFHLLQRALESNALTIEILESARGYLSRDQTCPYLAVGERGTKTSPRAPEGS